MFENAASLAPDDHVEKAWPFTDQSIDSLHLADFSTPIATIYGAEMADNIRAMAVWCEERNLSLAPHGKTTMAPSIWQLQLDAGAWAITVATAAQLRVARAAKVPRVVVANEFIDPVALAWTYAELEADPDWGVVCWVDSLEGVALMAAQHNGHSRPLDVCLELGYQDARSGARSLPELLEVARAVIETPALRLVGVAGYEGVITESAEASEIALVDGYLDRLLEAYRSVLPLCETDETIVSAGGSAYFDRIDAILGPLAGATSGSRTTRVVVRSGVYVVHDNGIYERIAPHQRGKGPQLTAAMRVWSRILSRPQPDLVLLDAGQRDLSFDEGMPMPEKVQRRGVWLPDDLLFCASIVKLNDQHAFLRIRPESSLAVGDVVRLGLSHPCTTFDKWAMIPILDDSSIANPRVTDLIRTNF